MATETWYDLGPVPGACTVCDADGALTMGEVRLRPTLVERLRREHVARPARLVTCSGCGWRWTVRSTDTPPSAVAAVEARTTVEPAPEQPRTQFAERQVDAAVAQAVTGNDVRVPSPADGLHDEVAAAPPAVPEVRGRHAAATLTVLPRPRERRALSARLR